MSDLKELLAKANEKAVAAKNERRARTVRGAHLTEKLVELAKAAGCDVRSDKSFHVAVGKAGKSLRVSIAQRGGTVYLVGFSLPVEGVKEITREAAKTRHIGRAMGELDFELGDEAVLAAFGSALERINVPAPAEEPKPAKEPRKPKAEKALDVLMVEASPGEIVELSDADDELATDIGDALEEGEELAVI